MENSVGDILICEEQLRTTLHCDDKEKLRRKLLLLQREYIRTAQRLQRAERSEAVRRHVRSRITQQNHQDQRDPEVTPCFNPSSLTVDTTNGTTSTVPQCQGHTGDSEKSTRSPVIRFTLPSDAACPQTTDPSQDAPKGPRPSPALRLRSRHSRLRWERRSEEGQEHSERMNTAGTQGSEDGAKHEGTDIVTESEGLFPSMEAESPSLLLTHWNTCGQTKTSTLEEKEIQGGQGQKEKATELRSEEMKESESTSLLQTCRNPAIHTKGKVQDGSQSGRGEEGQAGEEDEDGKGQKDGMLCEDGTNKCTEQNKTEQIEIERSHDNTAEREEEKSEMVGGEHDVKGASFLDSCTLVDGLLFPAEYYVRTTRRMTSSQSLPDMQAVILSQLSNGRHRRSRGRGRGLDRHAQSHKDLGQHSQTDFSSLTTGSPSVGPRMESQAADKSAELNSQSFSVDSDQISACQIDTDSCFSPTVSAPRSTRGRRRRRGRGAGRPQTPQCSLSLAHQIALERTSGDPQPTSSPLSSSPSLIGADAPKHCLTVPVPDNPPPTSAHSTATQLPSGGNEAQPNSSPGRRVYSIFMKSRNGTNGSTQMNRSPASCRSLLSPSPPQTSLLPLPSLSFGPLVHNVVNFDIPQDFHLPDDQFASLKLHKLRQVAVESGAEHFTLSPYNTRRSIRCLESHCSSRDAATPLPLPLSLTPTVSNSANSTFKKQTTTHSTDILRGQSLTEESCDRENPQQTENLQCQTQTTSAGFVPVGHDSAADRCEGKHTTQPHVDFADRPAGEVISQSDELQMKESYVISSEEHAGCAGPDQPLLIQRSPNHQTEDKANVKTLSFDCTLEQTPEEPSDKRTAVHAYNDSQVPGGPPVQHLNVESPAREISPEPTASPPRESKNQDKCLPLHSVHSQLLLSPQASAPFITPHLFSSAPHSSPTLPSVGLTPHPVPAGLALTSSPSAPPLVLPPPHSPSTQDLSPPDLSPCPSVTSLPPSQPLVSPAVPTQAQRDGPATLLTDSRIQSQDSGGQVGLRTEEAAEEHMMRCTHTLKAPAGGRLVDACCLPGSSGGLRVAAAGKWAVCLWNQTSASDWNLIHTWSFSEPVINVLPVPDAAGLMCVTLGQLEIREVRMLSSSSLLQVLVCEGLVQTVVCVPKSRVVTSSHSASGSTLQVFTLSDSGSTLSSQPLVSPGVCVGALAPVDGLPDALIGTDEDGRLFIWNLKTGRLLRRVVLGDALSHTACLRGYSDCGVLFVLLQHQPIISPEEEDREPTGRDQMFLEEEKKRDGETALLSLVAVNPLSGKSAVATRLHPPKAWCGRLCEADASGGSVVGLSQSGCVCVWQLGRRDSQRMVWAPESEGWQLARWGAEGGTLVTGHHNGDVTLHCHSTNQTSLCR